MGFASDYLKERRCLGLQWKRRWLESGGERLEWECSEFAAGGLEWVTRWEEFGSAGSRLELTCLEWAIQCVSRHVAVLVWKELLGSRPAGKTIPAWTFGLCVWRTWRAEYAMGLVSNLGTCKISGNLLSQFCFFAQVTGEDFTATQNGEFMHMSGFMALLCGGGSYVTRCLRRSHNDNMITMC